MKNILAISGSLRTGSSNNAILNYLKLQANKEVNYITYNLLDSLPPFDPGNDADNTPVAVTDTRKFIEEADGIIMCTPEYAFGVPAH